MKPNISWQGTAAALVLLGAMATPALAACPSLPDGPDSYNVTNGEQRSLCLQQQLHDNTIDQNTQTQIKGIQNSIQQLQIQRRFDNLPRIGQPKTWP